MKIDYQEPSKDLLMRIDIHEKYGSANIDMWTNELLQPKAGMTILDVGCGAGKLCFLFNDYVKGGAKITGGDFSEELLEKAREKNKKTGANIDFQFLDFNEKFKFEDSSFDLCTSAFAIYYASDLDFTFGEAHRVLKPGGQMVYGTPVEKPFMVFMFRLLGHNIRDEHFSTEKEIEEAAHKAFSKGHVIHMQSTPPIAGSVYTVGNFVK